MCGFERILIEGEGKRPGEKTKRGRRSVGGACGKTTPPPERKKTAFLSEPLTAVEVTTRSGTRKGIDRVQDWKTRGERWAAGYQEWI